MLQIDDTLVSLDVIDHYFECDLSVCKGQCCIEGESGAPLTAEEGEALKAALPVVYDEMLPGAQRVVKEQGVSYVDEDGDLVTSIVEGLNCVFTFYDENGTCLCLLEKAWREGRLPQLKPISCRLYPVRVTNYSNFRAVNYHRWSVCRCAEICGRKTGMRIYQFLRQPLTDFFGAEWYEKLSMAAEHFLAGEDSKHS